MADAVLLKLEVVHVYEIPCGTYTCKQVIVLLTPGGKQFDLIVFVEGIPFLPEDFHYDTV